MNVYAIGASRNTGYHTALRLLEKSATVTYLLRSPDVFKDDAVMQQHVRNGRANFVPGDALVEEDVAQGWAAAQSRSPSSRVDVVLFAIGSTFTGFSLLKGGLVPIRDLCTRALLNLIRTMPPAALVGSPRLVVVSAIGVTRASYTNLPLLYRPLCGWILLQTQEDKLGMERVLAWSMGEAWTEPEPLQEVLPSGWQRGIEEGSLANVLVVRPAVLTDGVSKGVYRVRDDSRAMKKGNNGWSVSRKDVAHFIVERALEDWEQWAGKRVCVGY